MNQSEIATLDSLLAIGPKDRIGERLLSKWGDLATLAANIDLADLTPRQKTVLRAALNIHFVREEKPRINCPADIVPLVADLGIEIQEHFVVLNFDRRNKLMKRTNLYKGSVNSAQVRIAEVFREAIILNASAVVIVHNHPSADPSPSPDDVALTRAIVQAGEILDIDVLDHIIISLGSFASLKERGLGFS